MYIQIMVAMAQWQRCVQSLPSIWSVAMAQWQNARYSVVSSYQAQCDITLRKSLQGPPSDATCQAPPTRTIVFLKFLRGA